MSQPIMIGWKDFFILKIVYHKSISLEGPIEKTLLLPQMYKTFVFLCPKKREKNKRKRKDSNIVLYFVNKST